MTRPEVEALHRALAEQLALGFLGHEGALCPMDDGALYVRGCIRLAPLVDAVLAAHERARRTASGDATIFYDDSDPALLAEAERVSSLLKAGATLVLRDDLVTEETPPTPA